MGIVGLITALIVAAKHTPCRSLATMPLSTSARYPMASLLLPLTVRVMVDDAGEILPVK